MQVPLESEVKKMQFQFKIPKGPASLHCKKKPINSSCGFLFKARSENHRSVDHRSKYVQKMAHCSKYVHTVAVWTPQKFFPLLIHPQGSQGCQKITFLFYKWKCFLFAIRLPPKKTKKKKKPIKIEEKMSKKPCFLRYFQIFFHIGAILARQT